jgi:membrane protease YdiL (CAAX protease family)
MRRRWRALIGAFFMIAFVVVYALFAMAIAQAPALQHAPALVQTPIYAVLGLAWILPLLPLIKWMERADAK